mgnify:CR=1 FL=1
MKPTKVSNCQKNHRGFTLIELLIAVVIVAVLATIAIVSYQSYIVRENRQLAEHSLTAAASKMEQYYAQNGRYTNGSGAWPSLFAESVSGSSGTVYTLSLVPSTPNAQSYAILATPQGNIQGGDGNICIDRQGNITWPASDANCGISVTATLTMPHENCNDVMYSTGKFASNYGGYPLCDDAHYPPAQYPNGCPVGVYYTCSANCQGSIVLRDCSGNCNGAGVTVYCSFGACSGWGAASCVHMNCGGSGASPNC